jgi:hypothetical protein
MILSKTIKLPKDIYNLCLSYLSENNIIYFEENWYKFPKNELCNIAARHGWFDLLKWARQNDYP